MQFRNEARRHRGKDEPALFEVVLHGLPSEFEAIFKALNDAFFFQRIEYCFELAWKTMKDYLEEGGFVFAAVTPRLVAELHAQFAESAKLEQAIKRNLEGLGYGL